MLFEAYNILQNKGTVLSARLLKKRAEILLIIGETEKGREIFASKNLISKDRKTYYNIVEDCINHMKHSTRLYQKEWGPNHFKALRVTLQFGRMQYLTGHLSPTSERAKTNFEMADITFEGLIKTHEMLYKDINDNHRANVLGDQNLILHSDIYIDYKYKMITNIFSRNFREAKRCMEHLKKIANLILNSNDQKEFLDISYYQQLIELKQYETAPEDVQTRMDVPNYRNICNKFQKIEKHLEIRDKINRDRASEKL